MVSREKTAGCLELRVLLMLSMLASASGNLPSEAANGSIVAWGGDYEGQYEVAVALPARGAHVPFTERVISTTANGAGSVFATDSDGDGDTDVLSTSSLDDKIAWYESDGASPPSFTERIISTTANGGGAVFATDLDGDGDTDVLSASRFDDKIAWYEKTGPSLVCGDGVVEGAEECDDGGESATCDADCTFAECGDETLNATAGEDCEPPGSDCCDYSCHFEPDGTPCQNDLYCDGDESCQSGECVDGPDPCVDLDHCDDDRDQCLSCIDDIECRDDDPCTEDACISNICVHTTIPDCQVCLSGDECEDGNPCTDDVCLRVGDLPGVCVRTNLIPGSPCPDDGNPCTDDECDGAGVCEHPSDDTNACDDDEFCNGEATCQSGECIDGPDPCIDPDHCDEIKDVCFVCVDDDECDDDDACTDDACIDHECVHNPRPGCGALAYLDIKPGSCPNPVNPGSKGVVPVAIIGSESFDVTQIDIDSLLLARADGVGGVAAPLGKRRGAWSDVADVGTEFDGEPCGCHELGADGIDDLLLKFSTPELAEVLELGSLPRATFVALTLSGSLLDGIGFEASDCIVIPGKDSSAAIRGARR